MPVTCISGTKNIFGFDLDYLPDMCKIYLTFEVKNLALNPIYVALKVIDGRYSFNGKDTVKLGSVGSASSKTFIQEMSANPLSKHTIEKGHVKAIIYKDSNYGYILGECTLEYIVAYIDKTKCVDFKEWKFEKGNSEGWLTNVFTPSDSADIDGSGWCMRSHGLGNCSYQEVGIYRNDINCGIGKFIGYAVGNNVYSAQAVVIIGDKYKVTSPISAKVFNYVVVSLHPIEGTNKVFLGHGLDTCTGYRVYIDDVRYYDVSDLFSNI